MSEIQSILTDILARRPVSLPQAERALAELEAMQAVETLARFISLNRDHFQECDPDGVKRSVLDQLATALERVQK